MSSAPKSRSVRRGTRKIKTDKKILLTSGISGVGGQESEELNPSFAILQNELPIQNGDSYIILGRDREHVPTSGYGGRGESNSYSIDLVVGRAAGNIKVVNKLDKISRSRTEEPLFVDPDFKYDAARIHISQKSDVDEYFNLTSPVGLGSVGNETNQSSIAMKADAVRIMSRNGMKLVAHVDENDSKCFKTTRRKGIDLISLPFIDKGRQSPDSDDGFDIDIPGMDEPVDKRNNMQPIPKGDNLREALRDVARQLDTVTGLFINFVKIQNEYNNALALHTHISPFFAITVPPSIDLIAPNVNQNISIFAETTVDTMEYKMTYLNKFQMDYLDPASENYINSRFHHLN